MTDGTAREERRKVLADMTRQAVADGTYDKPTEWFETRRGDPMPDMDTKTALVAEVERLRADLDQAHRGGKELGKVVDLLTELIIGAYRHGATDPVEAVHLLGNYLAELCEDGSGLSGDEHNRVFRALENHRTEAKRQAKRLQSVGAMHSPFRIYTPCGHRHNGGEPGVQDVTDVGLVCNDGYLYTACRNCCTDVEGKQTEECASGHNHSHEICPTRTALDGKAV